MRHTFHAGMVGKYIIEDLARIPVEVEVASEFRYRRPIIKPGQLFIIISQSGETADTLAAMREAKKRGAKVVAIVNVVGSTIAREADAVLYTHAGPEIAVASTKAYNTQLMAIYMIALELARLSGAMDMARYTQLAEGLSRIPALMNKVLENKDSWLACQPQLSQSSVFFIGRGLDYVLSMEASLKLKEISYIHSEAYAAGELSTAPSPLSSRARWWWRWLPRRLLEDDQQHQGSEGAGCAGARGMLEGTHLPDDIADEVVISRAPTTCLRRYCGDADAIVRVLHGGQQGLRCRQAATSRKA